MVQLAGFVHIIDGYTDPVRGHPAICGSHGETEMVA